MLPMLVAINLSKGRYSMSKKEVIGQASNAIQNFGAMDVLCTDQNRHFDAGQDHHWTSLRCGTARKTMHVLRLAYINRYYQTGLKNILDRANP